MDVLLANDRLRRKLLDKVFRPVGPLRECRLFRHSHIVRSGWIFLRHGVVPPRLPRPIALRMPYEKPDKAIVAG